MITSVRGYLSVTNVQTSRELPHFMETHRYFIAAVASYSIEAQPTAEVYVRCFTN